jgi:hypothetical protein
MRVGARADRAEAQPSVGKRVYVGLGMIRAAAGREVGGDARTGGRFCAKPLAVSTLVRRPASSCSSRVAIGLLHHPISHGRVERETCASMPAIRRFPRLTFEAGKTWRKFTNPMSIEECPDDGYIEPKKTGQNRVDEDGGDSS